MIKNVEIENFKSIKHVKLDCGRINIFIGYPNAGKSNILEAVVGFPSYGYYHNIRALREFIRMEEEGDLFYDQNLDDSIYLRFDRNGKTIKFEIKFYDNKYLLIPFYDAEGQSETFLLNPSISDPNITGFLKSCKFYRFTTVDRFQRKESEYLLPPFGDNLPNVILSHKDIKSIISQILSQFGFRIVFEKEKNEIKIVKLLEDVLIMYPYKVISDTFQRVIFFTSAIESNKNSIIAFEEPEAHAFPYYTKYIAELIALDKTNNQYFISTHNPYLLSSLLKEVSKDELRIFITYFKDYQTKVKPLSEKEIEEILEMDIDVFFNTERFLEE